MLGASPNDVLRYAGERGLKGFIESFRRGVRGGWPGRGDVVPRR